MNGPTCPAEGCDYNENGEKSKESVRRHMNAKTDEAHSDLPALRAALNAPEGTAQEGDEGASDDAGDGEQGEAAEEQDEQPENSETEHTEMANSDEYKAQHSSEDGENSQEDSTSSGGWSLPLPELSTSTLVVLVVAAVVVALLVRRSRSSNRQPTQEDETTGEQAEEDSETFSPFVEGQE